MTPAEISDRVSREADARFGETIEHLLRILDNYQRSSATCLNKWIQSGLLEGVPAEFLEIAALRLEDKHQQVVKESSHFLSKTTLAWKDHLYSQLYQVVDSFRPTACKCDTLQSGSLCNFCRNR